MAPSHLYLQQLARAYRFRDRYVHLLAVERNLPPEEFNDLEDFLWAAFLHIWHVKDWVKNDPSLSGAQKGAVISRIEAHRDLLVAADLANGAKHVALDNKRVGARDAAIQFVRNRNGSVTVHHLIELADGSELRASDAVDRALAALSHVLGAAGLPVYLDDARNPPPSPPP